MTDERLKQIYEYVVVSTFYTVGREKFLDSDISHEEMKGSGGDGVCGKGSKLM